MAAIRGRHVYEATGLMGRRRYRLARRGPAVTWLIGGFILETQRAEAQAIHTDAGGP